LAALGVTLINRSSLTRNVGGAVVVWAGLAII
jgi:hypothetical protein